MKSEVLADMGILELLGFVLKVVGKPVHIPRELIVRGFTQDTQISIVDDAPSECFIIKLEERVEKQESL